jgi:hypothetical protein
MNGARARTLMIGRANGRNRIGNRVSARIAESAPVNAHSPVNGRNPVSVRNPVNGRNRVSSPIAATVGGHAHNRANGRNRIGSRLSGLTVASARVNGRNRDVCRMPVRIVGRDRNLDASPRSHGSRIATIAV